MTSVAQPRAAKAGGSAGAAERNEVERFMTDIIRRNPGETEFHQAVREVAESVMPLALVLCWFEPPPWLDVPVVVARPEMRTGVPASTCAGAPAVTGATILPA